MQRIKLAATHLRSTSNVMSVPLPLPLQMWRRDVPLRLCCLRLGWKEARGGWRCGRGASADDDGGDPNSGGSWGGVENLGRRD